MRNTLVTLLLAFTLIATATTLAGCLDPHDTHVQTGVGGAR